MGKEVTTPDSRIKVGECRASHSGKTSLWQCHTVIWAHMKDALSTETRPSVASVGTTQRMATDDKVGQVGTKWWRQKEAWMWRHELVLGGGGQEELRINPWTSKPCLGFWDVDLNAVCPLCGWVLSERSCSFGSHEASAGFLSLAVLKVQRALPCHATTPFGRPLWQRWRPLPLLRTHKTW